MARLYIIGLSILLTAIFANYIIGKLGLVSWYDFLNSLADNESTTLKKLNILDYLWLFIVYPIVLGFGYLIGDKIHEIILG